MRIGLVADTHDAAVPWTEVVARIGAALDGVELLLHCGDLTTMRAVDDLASIAPVVAVRSAADPDPHPPTLLEGPHVLEADGLSIALVATLDDDLVERLGRRVDVVVHGGTHVASVERRGGVLFVNPGSPSLAERCTVATLDTTGPAPTATIVPL